MNRDFWINSFLLGFLCGVSVASRLVFGDSLFFYIVGLAVCFWMIVYLRVLFARKNGVRSFLLVVVSAFLMGGGRFLVDVGVFSEADVIAQQAFAPQAQMLVQVESLPDNRGYSWEALVSISGNGQGGVNGNVRALAYFPSQMEIEYGERFLISGQFQSVDDEEMPQNRRVNLFRKKAVGILNVNRVEKRLGWAGNSVLGAIFGWRGELLRIFSANLTEPSASLVAGILIGERGSLPEELADDFQVTGLTHILAISGFNITLIITLVVFAAAGLGKKRRFVVSFGVIVFFVIITGASASVVRAAVMGLLVLFVKTVGRRAKPLKIILMSVFLIVLCDPRLLNFDLSFQLSMMATLSLIWFSSWLEMDFRQGWKSMLWEGISTTLAAQIITLPLIFYHFGRISVISPVSNLIVGPLIPLMMILGAGVFVLSVIAPFATFILAGLTQLLINSTAFVVGILADFPGAQIELGEGALWLALLYYVSIFIVFRKRIPEPRSP